MLHLRSFAASVVDARPHQRRGRRRFRPRLERLDDRALLATFVVNLADSSASDSYLLDDRCDITGNPAASPAVPYSGQCSLRAAIEQANHTPEKDTILLGVSQVFINGVLPFVTEPVEVAPAGTSKVVLSGANQILNIQGGNSSIQNLIFDGVGLGISLKGNNTVQGNYIGAYNQETLANGTMGAGITINGASNNMIGGDAPRERNIISGHAYGVWITGGSQNNTVQGNYIGLDVAGELSLGNSIAGVYIDDNSNGNVIGSLDRSAGNVISANSNSGIYVSQSSDTTILGNHIGTNAAASMGRGNGIGIFIDNSTRTIIGGPDGLAGNVIAANRNYGVLISGASASETIVSGNLIGTEDPALRDVLGNAGDGVFIVDAPSNRIGGPLLEQGNVISGNGGDGIQIQGESAFENTIQNNFIGVDSGGALDVGNKGTGILITSAPRNQIGGEFSTGNLISGNDKSGIVIQRASATGNKIQGNRIGTTVDGKAPLPNEQLGVFVSGAPRNTVGGDNGNRSTLVKGNLISGNKRDGVLVFGADAEANSIMGNYIGTNIDGDQPLPNQWSGVYLASPKNIVGQQAVSEQQSVRGDNLISGNRRYGIEIIDSGAYENRIQGNVIGASADGHAAVPNELGGIYVADAPRNIIGGANTEATKLLAGNLISGNRNDGLRIRGVSAEGTLVQGNFIGTTGDGRLPLGNARHGINIEHSPNNLIGLRNAGEGGARNLVSANGQNGIRISGRTATNNTIRGALIGTDVTGAIVDTDGDIFNDNSLGNLLNGILISGAPGNRIEGAETQIGGTIVSGNNAHGIALEFSEATGNEIRGIVIGADVTERIALGNAQSGVYLLDAPGNFVGTPGLGNLIVGNEENGVHIQGQQAKGNVVQNNQIGINKQFVPTVVVSNLANGVLIEDAPENVIGTAGGRNYISGNARNGIRIWKQGATKNKIANNYIGLNDVGEIAAGLGNDLGNRENGLQIDGAPQNIVGGVEVSDRNTISGNQIGIRIEGSYATGNQIQNNHIGTDPTGGIRRGNKQAGISIENGQENIVGGDAWNMGNVISGNSGDGVRIIGELASKNRVEHNRIGAGPDGEMDLGNLKSGVVIVSRATQNQVQFNVVSGNDQHGIEIRDQSRFNKLIGNLIGTNRWGDKAVGNGKNGVFMDKSHDNDLTDNLISGNVLHGVELVFADGNKLELNRIGADFLGDAALGNTKHGVYATASSDNRIYDNQVSANGGTGIMLEGGSSRNDVAGNLIGTAANGRDPLGNGASGVFLSYESMSNRVRAGGLAGMPNVIAHNQGSGVGVWHDSRGNEISENAIFNNQSLGIDLLEWGASPIVRPLVTPNDFHDVDDRGNRLQNFPELYSVFDQGPTTLIEGVLDSSPSKEFTIELFSNSICDPSGHGEGETFIGSQVVATNGSGHADFHVAVPALPGNAIVTATARDNETMDTSEFSACKISTPPVTGVIQGRKTEDLDRDGRGDSTEPGRGGFTVELVDAATGSVVSTTQTAGAGVLCAGGEHFLEQCEAGVDSFAAVAHLQLDLDLDDLPESSVLLSGIATLQRDAAVDAIVGDPSLGSVGAVDGHLDVVEMELVEWNLGGSGIQLRAGDHTANLQNDSSLYSAGTLQESAQDTTQARGLLSVFFELDTAEGTLHNTEPLMLQAAMDQIYPGGETPLKFNALLNQPLALYDDNGVEKARLYDLVQTQNELGNYIFKDVDPGTYIVREQKTAGWTQVEPLSRSYTVVIDAGDVVSGRDFVNQQDAPNHASAPLVTSVTINTQLKDPVDLPIGAQPTNWRQQRSQIVTIEVNFDQDVVIGAADIVLINQGVDAANDADSVVNITAQHLGNSAGVVTLSFAPGELADGVYALEILPTATGLTGIAIDGNADGVAGDAFRMVGDSQNRLHQLMADFNGDGGASIFDFGAYAYWFGQQVPAAPSYMDLNGDGGVSIFDFGRFAGAFGKGVVYGPPQWWYAAGDRLPAKEKQAFDRDCPISTAREAALLQLLADWSN